ncbi:Germin protein [Dioscorea alata]|uniref:Germin protein n=1 Tax=Dioscorea alata TaxID=55571 RepID=A0ACB7U510_DIOAL|nr:Germin protein [Dioscorea alata]
MSTKTLTLMPPLVLLLLLSSLPWLTMQDPDLLMDYCVADVSRTPFFFNGELCIDPSLVISNHFFTSSLSKQEMTGNIFGSNTTTTTTKNLPGSNAQGLTMARIDLAPGGIVPLHSHPRGAEVVILIKGTQVMVGFVETKENKLYVQQLRPGDVFVFPKGLDHFLLNLDGATSATAIAGMSSQNPGEQVVPWATFQSMPNIPDEVLEKTFKVSAQDIKRIRKNLGG